MFEFTASDKALLDRAARHLLCKATELEKTYGQSSWGTDRKTRAAKLEFDRLHRDARDLRTTAQRLKAHAKKAQAETKQEVVIGLDRVAGVTVTEA